MLLCADKCKTFCPREDTKQKLDIAQTRAIPEQNSVVMNTDCKNVT